MPICVSCDDFGLLKVNHNKNNVLIKCSCASGRAINKDLPDKSFVKGCDLDKVQKAWFLPDKDKKSQFDRVGEFLKVVKASEVYWSQYDFKISSDLK